MMVHTWSAPPPAEWAQPLARFETQFTYPLGPGRSFRISHGDDYPRFFRAMGEAACFVAEHEGEVLGTLGAALRRLRLPDGQECAAVYLGDLKVAPAARGGRSILRLVGAAQQWAAGRAEAAFSVVMDGTAATPPRYTGRLGIPAFCELDHILVLRLPATAVGHQRHNALATDAAQGGACYRRLSAGRCTCLDGLPEERSQMAPLWLMTADGRACGRLEDTRRAKRLISEGEELTSAHLSCFAFADAAAGVALLWAARDHAARLGLPAVFTAVAPAEAEVLAAGLDGGDIVPAPATVYGSGLRPGPWSINTAEI
jgi:hypothetical protein